MQPLGNKHTCLKLISKALEGNNQSFELFGWWCGREGGMLANYTEILGSIALVRYWLVGVIPLARKNTLIL